MADDGLVHVAVPSPRAARATLTPHLLRLDPREITRVGQSSVTSTRRTIIDCLGRFDDVGSESLAAWALTRGALSADELERVILAHSHAWGSVRRRRALRDLRTGATGAAERRLHRLLHAANISGWSANESLHEHLGVWANADIYFPDCRLVIEVDGAEFHGADRFQHDRTRQNRLVTAGCTVLRFTWDDLTQRPGETVALVRATLTRLRAVR